MKQYNAVDNMGAIHVIVLKEHIDEPYKHRYDRLSAGILRADWETRMAKYGSIRYFKAAFGDRAEAMKKRYCSYSIDELTNEDIEKLDFSPIIARIEDNPLKMRDNDWILLSVRWRLDGYETSQLMGAVISGIIENKAQLRPYNKKWLYPTGIPYSTGDICYWFVRKITKSKHWHGSYARRLPIRLVGVMVHFDVVDAELLVNILRIPSIDDEDDYKLVCQALGLAKNISQENKCEIERRLDEYKRYI